MTPSPDQADEHLGTLFHWLLKGGELDPFTREWLAMGTLRALRRNESLDRSLGLSARGADSLQRRVLRAQRDLHLKAAVDAVALLPDVNLWDRCKRLAPLLDDFAATTWPAARRRLDPPEEWPAWKRSAFRAMQTDIKLPTTAERLYRVTSAIGAYCGSDRGIKVLAKYL